MEKIAPLTLDAFLENVKRKTAEAREVLVTDWLQECSTLIDDERDEIERWMPENPVSLLSESGPKMGRMICALLLNIYTD